MTNEQEIEAARNWFSLFRQSVVEIADPEFQGRVWMRDIPDMRSSYVEVELTILEDTPFELISSNLREIGLTEKEWSAALHFCDSLREFNESSVPDPYDVRAVITHPGWSALVSKARSLLALLPSPDC